jgi:hypothetical protein
MSKRPAKTIVAGLLACVALADIAAAEVTTPQSGTQERRDILNSVRVMVGYDFGGPIELVVHSLEIENGFGLMTGYAQRPGGVPIDMSQTPMVLRDRQSPDTIDGPTVQAFVTQLNGHWYVHEYAVGPTDVWWMGDPYCENYSAFLPEQAC